MLVLAATVAVFAFAGAAHAQGGIQVSPTRVDITVDQGGWASTNVTVCNRSGQAMGVVAYVMDFDADYAFFEPGDESYSAARWFSVNGTAFELGQGECRRIEVVITPPAHVEPGGHYAALFFQTAAAQSDGGLSVSARIPALFYITVPGATEADVIADAEIASLILPGTVGGKPVEVGAVVRNTGNVHLGVAARAYFVDLLNRRSELDLGQALVLPGGEAQLKGTWPGTPFIGRVKTSVVIGFADESGALVNKARRGGFWVIPWVPLIAAGVPLVALVALAVVMRRRYRVRLERRPERETPS